MLLFRGAPALSAFRIERLLATLPAHRRRRSAGSRPTTCTSSTRDARPPAGRAPRARAAARLRRRRPRRSRPARLAARRAASRHDLAVVVEGDRHRARLRTRRRAAHRARPGLAHRRGRRRWRPRTARRSRRSCIDPMTEALCSTTRPMPRACSRQHEPAPLGRIALGDDPAAALAARERVARASHCPTARSPTWRTFPATRPRPDGRRGDDVRAGEQRALPPQDLQCRLEHRRRSRADARCSR